MENQNLKDQENINKEQTEEALLYSEPVNELQPDSEKGEKNKEHIDIEPMNYAKVDNNELTDDEEINEKDNDGFDTESIKNARDIK